MSPAEFRAIRLKLGLTLEQWGRALGYANPDRSELHRIENGHKTLTERTARLAHMFGLYGVPPEFLK